MKKITFLIISIFFVFLSVFAQEMQIRGVVTDENDEPMIGVSVVVKGSNIGTISNIRGEYTLSRVRVKSVLEFSFVGYQKKTVDVANSRIINVKMEAAGVELDDVIVVGYGTMKKSDLTGSIASIKADDIIKTGNISIDQSLAGKVSGVVVTQGSGVPGSGSSITIRGASSMRGSDPLYVIDGVPMDNTSLTSMQGGQEAAGNMSPLSLINPSDIESMEILKDASATAIYGSRGSNGVVLITTKSGKSGKGKITVDADYGVSELPHQLSLLNASEYTQVLSEARFNTNSGMIRPTLLDSARLGQIPTVNWQDVVFRQGITQNYNIGLTGGKKDLRYNMSSNFYDTKGIVEKSNFQRVSTRLNLDGNINSLLTFGTRINYSLINSSLPSTTTNFDATKNSGTNSAILRALRMPPNLSLDTEEDQTIEKYSPDIALRADNYTNQISQFIGSAFLKLTLSKALYFKTDFSYQIRNASQRYYQKNILPEAYSRGGWAKTNDSKVVLYSNTNTLNYSKKIKKNKLDLVLGQSLEWFESSSFMTSNYGFPNDLLTYFAPHTATFMDPDIYQYSDSRLVSFFARINYTLQDKFLFTLTGRTDGSSKFAANNKFGFFPAAALGYRLSEEKFIKNLDFVSNIKLRLSYGLSGNQALSAYQALDQLSGSMMGFGNGSGGEALYPVYYATQLPNANLQWENTAQLNGGIDIGFFNNRITATIDLYNKRTDNLLVVGNKIPAQSGFISYTENMGLLGTKGIELGLNFVPVQKKKFNWNLGVIFSTGKTKLLEMGADYLPSGYNMGWVAGGTQRLIIGEELGAFYGYQRAGISQFEDFVEFQGLTNEAMIELYNTNPMAVFTPLAKANGDVVIAQRPGEQLYKDVVKDGVINALDRTVIGRAQPDFIFGLNNTISFGNFELSFMIDGQYGKDVCNVTNFNLLAFNGEQQSTEVLKRWTPEHPSTVYPRLDALKNGAPAFVFSDRYVEDASFVRLQNLTFSYILPTKLVQKIKLGNVKIYASGSNLFTITNYSGYNPDVSLTGSNTQQMGHDNSGYPTSRTIRLGLNLSL